jgi:hypothetical protein
LENVMVPVDYDLMSLLSLLEFAQGRAEFWIVGRSPNECGDVTRPLTTLTIRINRQDLEELITALRNKQNAANPATSV